jgi:putative uncharacterized protein (fragment)
MKKRILSLVLCAAMLLSMCLFLGAGVTNSLTVCDSSGEAVKRVDLPVNQKISLTAQAQSAAENDAYQWQIRAAKNVWANILGSDTQTLELSYPMVASALSEKNTVQIRCRLTSAETGEATFSDAVTVEVTAATAVDTPASADAAAAPVLRSPAKAAAAANDAYGTYTIIIKYQFADGTQAANPWSATVADGTTYTQDVTSPTVVGYAPDQPVVHVDSSKATEYTVTYQPAEVEFTVKHYQQNVADDNYTLLETETKNGYTESQVGNGLEKNTKTDTKYSGFYSLLYDTTTKIAADGSTVVEIYYDRYYYLMNFDLDGGYGVEPIYARYGAPISVGTPTKPGYSFNGWNPKLPATMPAENTTHKATWNAGTTSYTVVYWYENANDDGYSYVADQKITNVAPGTSVSSDTYKDANFNNKDAKHFTYNANKTETVTVAGDGSTILNVYFTRNTYTLTFKDGQKTLTCGKEEHTHTHDGWYYKASEIEIYYYGGCYPPGSYNGVGTGKGGAKKPTCGKSEHTHSSKCYTTSDLTITAKYQADIHKNFPIKDGDETIWWKVPNGTETYGELDQQTYLGSIDTMPGENITFKKYDTESGAKIYYYVETLNGTSGDTTYNGKNYTQYKVIDLDYSTNTNLTYKEEFHPITGFTQGDSKPILPKDGEVRMQENNYLYYTRNSYKLKFYNYNADVAGEGGSVQYEAPLSGYEFKPDYPANLEENAYEFAGWYTTAGCYAGSEVNWATATMPASDVTLYAKWVPITHTVKTYKTENDLNGVALKEWTVSHGTAVPENDPPVTPENGNYTFVGWFYKDANGTEHAFDFSMPVTKDLNLYAKWSSNTLVKYTIKYAVRNKDGTLTYIADDTKGSALALTTKTFEAKTGDQLNEGYQSGYFPETSSHSITMDIDNPAKNEYTFVYVPKAEVEYTVKYLEKGTETQLANPKTVKTRDAVVTETFKQISGYAPDAYQKRLVLSADDAQNVITFWYVKDEIHAPVQVIHWTQNIAGGGYTEYQSSTNLNGVIGNTYTETPLTIPGFRYNAGDSQASGRLTASGLVLNLYYDRIAYPYEFRFLEQGTDKQLAVPVTGTARYQAQVTQKAETIPGYALVNAENQAINIAIEDPAGVAKKNVKTFYYQEQTVDIKYVAVGFGTLDNVQDSNVKVLSGTVQGSTPTANEGYKFVGWFEDEACTQAVNKAWVNTGTNKLTPQKSVPYGDQKGYGAATYYAKFERDVFDLTIEKKAASDSNIDPNQTFVFRVQGEGVDMQVVITGANKQVIKNLPVGDYTITEDTSWSWKYTPVGGATQELKSDSIQDGTATVTFKNENKGTNWLTSLAKAINTWAGGTAHEK